MEDTSLKIAVVVVLVFAGVVAITDIWKKKVYNVITFPLMLTGMIYHAIAGGMESGWQGAGEGFAMSFLGILFGLAVLVLPYSMGGMTSGDVKLLMAIGAWLKWKLTFYVFLAGSLAAGCCAFGLMFYYSSLTDTWWNFKLLVYRMMTMGLRLAADDKIEDHLTDESRRKKLIPFGAMLFLGVIGLTVWLVAQELNAQ